MKQKFDRSIVNVTVENGNLIFQGGRSSFRVRVAVEPRGWEGTSRTYIDVEVRQVDITVTDIQQAHYTLEPLDVDGFPTNLDPGETVAVAFNDTALATIVAGASALDFIVRPTGAKLGVGQVTAQIMDAAGNAVGGPFLSNVTIGASTPVGLGGAVVAEPRA